MIFRNTISYLIITSILLTTACNKILEEKTDKSMIVPKSIQDYQALLDYPNYMNELTPTLDEFLSDDYYLPDNTYDALVNKAKNAYIWGEEPYNGPSNDWAQAYNIIYYCNLALEGISKIKKTKSNAAAWNNVKGSALLYRAKAFLHTAIIFCKAYEAKTAKKDYGIVLRVSSNFNQKSTRASLESTYRKIINDLKVASRILPDNPITPYRPSRCAAYAILARTYLSIREYENAGKYADSCLNIKNDLLDYNTLDPSSLSPYPEINPEIIFQQYSSKCIIAPISTRVDTTLYSTYSSKDLRKSIFFQPLDPGYYFKGNYSGHLAYFFTGMATDEIYLIRAECNVRAGKINKALKDLNILMKNRIQKEYFNPLNENNSEKLLSIILLERKKELLFRCLRWLDIKRLNIEGVNIELKRKINGKLYKFNHVAKHYAFPLPADIIEQTGMPQN